MLSRCGEQQGGLVGQGAFQNRIEVVGRKIGLIVGSFGCFIHVTHDEPFASRMPAGKGEMPPVGTRITQLRIDQAAGKPPVFGRYIARIGCHRFDQADVIEQVLIGSVDSKIVEVRSRIVVVSAQTAGVECVSVADSVDRETVFIGFCAVDRDPGRPDFPAGQARVFVVGKLHVGKHFQCPRYRAGIVGQRLKTFSPDRAFSQFT